MAGTVQDQAGNDIDDETGTAALLDEGGGRDISIRASAPTSSPAAAGPPAGGSWSAGQAAGSPASATVTEAWSAGQPWNEV